MSIEGFLSNNYISIDNLLQFTRHQINVYFVYTDFLF